MRLTSVSLARNLISNYFRLSLFLGIGLPKCIKMAEIMYKCTFCKKTVAPRTPCKKVVHSKIFHHPYRPKVQRRWVYDKSGRLKQEWVDDKGGVGPQITGEQPICPECAVKRGVV